MAANRKLLAVAAACAAVVIGVTGCSGDDGGDKDPFEGMSADKIAKKASKTSKNAGSFTMKSQVKEDGGQATGEFSVVKGGDCKATIDSRKSGHSEIVTVGKSSYMKADEKYWKTAVGATLAGRVKGRWVKSEPSQGQSSCALGNMFESKKFKGLKREKDAQVDGKKAAVLVKKKGDETTTFYVAMEGKPYFVKVANDGDEKGTATFSGYGEPVDVKAPAPGEVVDQKELAGL
ncbi:MULTISPECIES: hypothetical protein [Streptomyces]|uniref:Lipoprotein n=1 Tax=Streptomyces lasiicapitis TaxID=1923961 RepID=A0ABQ2LI29_9ACTN|nr:MULTISPECIES: hypothetical protein [Streptomyces]QIB43700.1 hypothetical protein G3H79_11955 [Streptomyces aureoverticillatus]GGO34130.1 hypothetical protein GCM10012286_02700 [Streptomyces lasiicapitis]